MSILFPLLLNPPAEVVATDYAFAGSARDKVILDGQDYYIVGPVTGKVLTEFEDGFKIGKATYDQREHAFFLTMDDFSAGFGHRRMPVDNPVGFWDSDRANSPDLSRPGHVTLGPYMDTIDPPVSGFGWSDNVSIQVPRKNTALYITNVGTVRANDWIVAFGNTVWQVTGNSLGGAAYNRLYTIGGSVAPIGTLERYTDKNGLAYGFLFGYGMFYHKGIAALFWDFGPNDSSIRSIDDGIFWDEKMVVAGPIASQARTVIYYGTMTDGVMTWNIDDTNDGVPITAVNGAADTVIQFLGVAEAPWGQPAVYFTDMQDLYVLDFYTRKSYRIDIGLTPGGGVTAACIWSGKFYLADGWNVFEYDPSSRQSRNVGLARRDGVPNTLRSSTVGQYSITNFIPADDRLYAILSGGSTLHVYLFQMPLGKEGAWSQVGQGETETLFSNLGFEIALPQNGLQARFIHIPAHSTHTSTTPKVLQYWLPGQGRVPIVGVDRFAPSGANWTTGWFDGGFADVYGPALRLSCDAWHLTTTETVKVEYQLDNAEDSTWVQMVDGDGNPSVFNDTRSILYFDALDPYKGIKFRTIRWRFTLTRGADDTLSPELRALTFVYFKKPAIRTAWSFKVDACRMTEEHVQVAGVDATHGNIWAALRNTWTTKPLVDFTVPSIQAGMRVSIQSLAIVVDDIREEVGANGDIDVTVLEPVSIDTS